MREALAAQVLAEVDQLVARVEALPGKVSDAEAQLKATTEALTEAADNFRLAVTAFASQAKDDLTEHLQRKAAEVVARTVEELRVVMQESARVAFKSLASDQANSLAATLRAAATPA